MTKRFGLLACGLCAALHLVAQQPVSQPSARQETILIWPGAAPDATPAAGPEADTTTPQQPLIAGRPVLRIGNVSTPALTFYPARGANTGAAILVFPGGAYRILAFDLEGTEVCDWLTSRGIACALLKYRVPGSGPYPKSPQALEDAQRALGIVRSRAAEWNIDPHRIGVLGFSAGAHLAAALSTHFDHRLYAPVDPADVASCRPDFAVLIYPGYMRAPGNPDAVNPDLPVAAQTPPTFLLQTEDDRTAQVESSLVYFEALKKANVPAEMHIYAEGVHGYGLRRTALPVTAWPQLVETWLRTIKMMR